MMQKGLTRRVGDALPETSAAGLLACQMDGEDAVQTRLGGLVVQVSSKCPHRGAPMAEASLVGPFIVCKRHGATFDLRTGKWIRGPACKDLKVKVMPDASDAAGSDTA